MRAGIGLFAARLLLAGILLSTTLSFATPAHADNKAIIKLREEIWARNYGEAVAIVERMAQRQPKVLNTIEFKAMSQVLDSLKREGRGQEYVRLLAVLASPVYAPESDFGSNEEARFLQAAVLADAGDSGGARRLIASLETPELIARASLDPRHRAYFPSDPDLRAAAELQLSLHRTLVQKFPRRLQSVLLVARDLVLLGRPQEAMEVLRSVEKRVGQRRGFADAEEWRSWWWNDLASAHAVLGEYDAAIASLRNASERQENGKRNTSHLISLARLQTTLADGRGALETLAIYGSLGATPDGAMRMRLIRGCAYAFAGRAKDAAVELAFLKTHEAMEPAALRGLLLCMGNLDEAAATFIRHLEDRELRADALLDLSEFDTPTAARARDPILSRLPALKARQDIQAAIRRAGGTRRFNIRRP